MYPNVLDVIGLIAWLLLPSIFIAEIVCKIVKSRISVLETFLISEVIWLFIFTSGAIIFGLFGGIFGYFTIFSIVAPTLSVLGVISLMWRVRLHIEFDPMRLPLYICVFLLIVLAAIFTLYHHIWSEFDVISIYLPTAKGILTTGSLTFNPFDYSTSVTMFSPGLCITYAYSMFLNPSLDIIRLIPIFYFVFGALATYLLGFELFGKKDKALITVIVFLSFIAVLKSMAQFSLYTDIPFVFLLVFTSFLLTKWVKEKTNLWLFIGGIVLSLILFFKPSFGYMIVPTVIGLLLLFGKQRWSKYLGVIVAFLPLHLETFVFILRPWVSMNFSATYSKDVINLLLKWSPAALISIVIILFLRKQKLPDHLSIKGFAVFLVPFASFGVYLVYYFLEFGLLLYPHQLLNPSMEATLSQYFQIMSSSSSANITRYFSWYNLLYDGLAGPYLVPLFLGIYATIKHLKCKNIKFGSYMPSILVFASLLALWSYLGSGYEPRRLFLLGPFVAILIVQGAIFMTRLLKLSLRSGILSFCMFVCLALGYFWARIENIEMFSLTSFGLSSFELIDYYVLASFFVFVMMFPKFLDFASSNLSIFKKIHMWKKRLFQKTSILLVITLLSQVIIISNATSFYLLSQSYEGDFNDPQSMERFYVEKSWNTKYLLGDFTDVISYFNDLEDQYSVLGFYIHYLKLFSDRSVIDLTWPHGYEKFGSIFDMNPTEALEALYLNDIRYVLVPTNNHVYPSVYQTYLKSQSTFPFLNSTDSPLVTLLEEKKYALKPMHHFMCYDLYSIEKLDYPFRIIPLVLENADYVEISSSSSLDIQANVTVESWVYMDELPSQTGLHFEISGKQWNVLRFFVSASDDKLAITQSYDGTSLSHHGKTALMPKRWYHLAYTFDGFSLKIYVDSIQDFNITRKGELGVNTYPLILHGFRNDAVNSTSGMIASFRIYNRALTNDELVWNFGNTMNPITNDLVLWFKFDEGTDNVLHDASGNNNTGTINGRH